MGKKAKIDYDQQAESVKGSIEPTADERISGWAPPLPLRP